jgi:hypothetical protein
LFLHLPETLGHTQCSHPIKILSVAARSPSPCVERFREVEVSTDNPEILVQISGAQRGPQKVCNPHIWIQCRLYGADIHACNPGPLHRLCRAVNTYDVQAWSTFEKRFDSEEIARKTSKLCIDPVLRTSKKDLATDRAADKDSGAKALRGARLLYWSLIPNVELLLNDQRHADYFLKKGNIGGQFAEIFLCRAALRSSSAVLGQDSESRFHVGRISTLLASRAIFAEPMLPRLSLSEDPLDEYAGVLCQRGVEEDEDGRGLPK